MCVSAESVADLMPLLQLSIDQVQLIHHMVADKPRNEGESSKRDISSILAMSISLANAETYT